MKYGHLERVSLVLRALSPVFIGSGERLNKKEYIFDVQNRQIHFPDLPRLVSFLKKRSLLSAYENFLANPRLNDLQAFLADRRVTADDYCHFVQYSIDAGEAVRAGNFREVLIFVKDPEGKPYIPGSSLKGAIRTALAAWLLQQGDWERDRSMVEKADSAVAPRRYLSRESDRLERRIFYRLNRRDRQGQQINNAVNDLMQAIRISDSRPLSYDNLTLVGKYDRKPDGTVSPIPIFRECLMPSSQACLEMTLDLPMLAQVGMDADTIEKALHYFAEQHYARFEQYFAELPEDADTAARQGVDVILGGGAGYVSKTVTYNLFPDRERALRIVSKIMVKHFPGHNHNSDVNRYKVSPHTLKTTVFREEYYPMGRCELLWQ